MFLLKDDDVVIIIIIIIIIIINVPISRLLILRFFEDFIYFLSCNLDIINLKFESISTIDPDRNNIFHL